MARAGRTVAVKVMAFPREIVRGARSDALRMIVCLTIIRTG